MTASFHCERPLFSPAPAGPLLGELLSAVRLLLCMDWELYWHQYTAAPAIPVVSHWNELKVFKYLRCVHQRFLFKSEAPQGEGG